MGKNRGKAGRSLRLRRGLHDESYNAPPRLGAPVAYGLTRQRRKEQFEGRLGDAAPSAQVIAQCCSIDYDGSRGRLLMRG